MILITQEDEEENMKLIHKRRYQNPKIYKNSKNQTLSRKQNQEEPSDLVAIKSDHSLLDSVVVVRESIAVRVKMV